MTALLYPGAVETYGYDIDNRGTIIGYYLDESGNFARWPCPDVRPIASGTPQARLASSPHSGW